MLQNKSTV